MRAGELVARWPHVFEYDRLWRAGYVPPAGAEDAGWPWFLVDEEQMGALEAEGRLRLGWR